MSTTQLNGKIALVTGAARGMGASHARAVVDNGGKVVIADVLDTEGEALADELGAENAVFIHLDVTDADQWATAVQCAVDTFGGLNVLVNNAGISNFGPLGSYPLESWNKTLAVNLTGPYLGITAALDALKASAPSSVINVGSGSAFQGQAALHGYTASKWGVRGLTRSAALELGPFGIRVNAVHPGYIRTPMTEALGDQPTPPGPLARAAEPEEVSSAVIYLAGDASSFCTGADFLIDGGLSAGPFTGSIEP
ncbi:SDR family oxidoreductase [Streptomyces sp. NPDC057137]|uniref:SDR family oxidoreductase n=1 Tax=Streptomyces sp. NPDC057137 TaxID=3346030 RepID=UPI003631E0E1